MVWHPKVIGFSRFSTGHSAIRVVYCGPIEHIGEALVMLGLFTRWAAFLCSGLMAAAYWMAHGFNALFPIEKGGELAALYCFVFLYISARDSGAWSMDEAMENAKM